MADQKTPPRASDPRPAGSLSETGLGVDLLSTVEVPGVAPGGDRFRIRAMRGERGMPMGFAERLLAAEAAPGPQRAEIEACLVLHRKGDTDAALHELDRLRASYGEVPLLHNIAGSLLAGRGDFRRAIGHFESALRLFPEFWEAHNNLGMCLLRSGQVAAGIEHFESALRLHPRFAEARANLGLALVERGQYAAAARSCELALADNPSLATAYEALGTALQRLGDRDAAADSFRTGAGWYQQRRDAEGAVRCLSELVRLQPEDCIARQSLGELLGELGRLEEAAACMRDILRRNPGSESAAYWLSVFTGKTPVTMPAEVVRDIFDTYANGFDESMQRLDYNAPAVLRDLYSSLGLAHGKRRRAVDLGCGTGLAGIQFADCCEKIVGIDVSPNMLAKASERGVYTRICRSDIVTGLDELNERFDLFIATDVFIYVGDLEPAFSAIKACAAPGAILLFTTEHIEGDGFALQKSGRFAHARAYVEQLAEVFAFRVLSVTASNLRLEGAQALTGGFYALAMTD